jgi:hypothetical protein
LISVGLVVRKVEEGAGVMKVCRLCAGEGWLVQDITSRVVFVNVRELWAKEHGHARQLPDVGSLSSISGGCRLGGNGQLCMDLSQTRY